MSPKAQVQTDRAPVPAAASRYFLEDTTTYTHTSAISTSTYGDQVKSSPLPGGDCESFGRS